MDTEKRSTRFGAAIIIFAVILRLVSSELASPTYARRNGPESSGLARLPASALSAAATVPAQTVPSETTPPQITLPPQITPPPATTVPVEIPKPVPIFTAEDTRYISLRTATDCGYYPLAEEFLLQSLQWDLDSGEPTVLIYHSHACEAYTKEAGQIYDEQANCRTTDTDYNMVAVGDALAAILEASGITVLHDRQLHDNPSYNMAYTNSRISLEEYLARYPSIKLVLDLHRDAATNADGSAYATSAIVNGQPAAQVMFVVGTDYSGGYHPDWEENLSVALKLQAVLEQTCPGITRSTILRGSRFNQDMCAGALLIEVGASGNTLTEVYRTLPILAQAITILANGANVE